MRNKPWKIAVVDDDESMCRALARLLQASTYSVRVYSSAEAFLLDPHHDLADFLVLDVQLGGMSGFDLKKALDVVPDAPPVAFITAHDEPAIRERAWKAGCVAYLRKPFAGQMLLDAIRSTLKSEAAP